jgi:hypothetical protein
MSVTVDWDGEIPPAPEDSTASNMLAHLRDKHEREPWELRKSSSGEGWHFIAYDALNSTARGFARSFKSREDAGDDDKRRRLDRKRWELNSPFMQVLYRRKYMERSEWPAEDGTGYSTGHDAEVIEQNTGVKAAPERERIKQDDGSLDYLRIAELLADTYGSAAALARKQDVSARTVYRWLNGESGISTENRKGLRRKARSQGIGHYAETDDGGKAADEVRFIDPDDERRTLVEYVDVPLDFDIGEDDREYGLLNIHTGSYNDNHTDRQLHAVHQDVADRTLEILSPRNPKTGTELNLDEQNTHYLGVSGWTREADSVNYERELLDDGEADVYLDNLPANTENDAEPEDNIIFEIILWDDGMTSIEWHVIGLWTGSTWRDATILKDEGLGDWTL